MAQLHLTGSEPNPNSDPQWACLACVTESHVRSSLEALPYTLCESKRKGRRRVADPFLSSLYVAGDGKVNGSSTENWLMLCKDGDGGRWSCVRWQSSTMAMCFGGTRWCSGQTLERRQTKYTYPPPVLSFNGVQRVWVRFGFDGIFGTAMMFG